MVSFSRPGQLLTAPRIPPPAFPSAFAPPSLPPSPPAPPTPPPPLPPLPSSPLVPQRITLREFLVGYYFPKFVRRADQERTRAGYLTAIEQLAQWAGRDPYLDELTAPALSFFEGWLAGQDVTRGKGKSPAPRKRSPQTVLKAGRHVRAPLSYAAQLGLAPVVPRFRSADADARNGIIPFSVEEMAAMLRVVDGIEGSIGCNPARRFWRALLLTLYETGARISAVMAVQWPQFAEIERSIVLEKQTQKQRKAQHLGLTAATAAAISALHRDAPRIFDWPFDVVNRSKGNWVTLTERFRLRILQPAGVADQKGHAFHRFRAATATELDALAQRHIVPDGANTEQLGHSGRHVTDKFYVARKHVAALRHADKLPPIDRRDDPQRPLFDWM